MATPLEGIVDVSTKGEFSVKAKAYNGESFRDAVTYMQDAAKIDISTDEGLKAYETLTGEKLGGQIGEKADFYKEQGDKLRGHGVMTYAEKHFGTLLGELDEGGLMNFALNYVPKNPLKKPGKNEDPDAYEIARDAAHSAIKTMERIDSEPNNVIEEAMKDKDFAKYVAMDPQGYLAIEKSIAQERATLAIGKFGAKKFVTTTKKGLEAKTKERDAAFKEVDKQAKERGEVLTAQERADLFKSGNLGQYQDCGLVNDMYQGVIGPATRMIKIKEDEKKAKDAEKKDKKDKKK